MGILSRNYSKERLSLALGVIFKATLKFHSMAITSNGVYALIIVLT